MHESDIIDLVHEMMEGDIADPALWKRVQAYREKIKSLKPDIPEEKPDTRSEDTDNLSVLEQKKETARKLQEKEPLTDAEKEALAKLTKEIDELQGLPINTHNGSLDISQVEITNLDDFIKLAETVADGNGIVRFSDGKQMHIDDLKFALEQAMETGDTSYLTRSG